MQGQGCKKKKEIVDTTAAKVNMYNGIWKVISFI